MPHSQSAYCQYHSTETAVTYVYSDMLLAADNGQVTALCLLDLMAAFDTVNHRLLMLTPVFLHHPVTKQYHLVPAQGQ